MKSFTRLELICSLVCPVLVIAWSAFGFVSECVIHNMEFLGSGAFRISYIIGFVFGGVLPIILTFALQVHTEDYLKKRLIVTAAAVLAANLFGMYSASLSIAVDVFRILIYFAAYIFGILKVQTDYTAGKERAVLMLSDPVLYLGVYCSLVCVTDCIYPA